MVSAGCCDFVIDFNRVKKLASGFRDVLVHVKRTVRKAAEKRGQTYRGPDLPPGEPFRVFVNRYEAAAQWHITMVTAGSCFALFRRHPGGFGCDLTLLRGYNGPDARRFVTYTCRRNSTSWGASLAPFDRYHRHVERLPGLWPGDVLRLRTAQLGRHLSIFGADAGGIAETLPWRPPSANRTFLLTPRRMERAPPELSGSFADSAIGPRIVSLEEEDLLGDVQAACRDGEAMLASDAAQAQPVKSVAPLVVRL